MQYRNLCVCFVLNWGANNNFLFYVCPRETAKWNNCVQAGWFNPGKHWAKANRKFGRVLAAAAGKIFCSDSMGNIWGQVSVAILGATSSHDLFSLASLVSVQPHVAYRTLGRWLSGSSFEFNLFFATVAPPFYWLIAVALEDKYLNLSACALHSLV